MQYLAVVLLLWMSGTSLAVKSQLPRTLTLNFFNAEGQHAKVKLNLKRLRKFASKGELYAQQAETALHSLRLLERVDDPLLMIHLLYELNRSETLSIKYERELSRNESNSSSYQEQKVFWEKVDKTKEYQNEIGHTYEYVNDVLNYESPKLLKILSQSEEESIRWITLDKSKELWGIWVTRRNLEDLFIRYKVADNEMTAEHLENLISSITEKITAHDKRRVEEIQAKLKMTQGFTALQNIGLTAFYRGIVNSMLHGGGIEGHTYEETELQLLISDFWAAHAWQQYHEEASKESKTYVAAGLSSILPL